MDLGTLGTQWKRDLKDTVITSEPREFKHGLCSCLGAPKICFHACCCPCFRIGVTEEQLNKTWEPGSWWPVNTMCCLAFFTHSMCPAVPLAINYAQRTRIMNEHNIKGKNSCKECCKPFCCYLCSMCQQARELSESDEYIEMQDQ